MKVKIKGLGVLFSYPFGVDGPAQTLRQYVVEAADGRIDKIEEWDEPPTPDGEYDLPNEDVEKIFDKPVVLAEGEW